MIEYRVSTDEDTESLLRLRLEVLRKVNHLDEEYRFSDELIEESRNYFQNGKQITVLAVEGEKIIGCASLCFIHVMPTFSHPSGKRAHLMNVYTAESYRRQGIARKMTDMLINLAWERGVTEISLDATKSGRPLYLELGFTDSDECMVLTRPE